MVSIHRKTPSDQFSKKLLFVLDSKFIWSHQNTLLLIDEYEKLSVKFRNPKIKKKVLWELIAAALQKKGYLVTADQADRKMRNMKTTFKTICDNNNKKRTGRGKIPWPYYNRLLEIFKDDKTIHPQHLMASIHKVCDDTSGEYIGEKLPDVVEEKLSRAQSKVVAAPIELVSPKCTEIIVSPKSISSPATDTPKRQKKLDNFRKRQLEIENEKLEEIKKLRAAVEDSNRISLLKCNVLKTYLGIVDGKEKK